LQNDIALIFFVIDHSSVARPSYDLAGQRSDEYLNTIHTGPIAGALSSAPSLQHVIGLMLFPADWLYFDF